MSLIRKAYIHFFLILCFSLFAFSHKYYFSIAEINYNHTQQSYQVILSLFADDVETVLSKQENQRVRIDSKDFEQKLSKYINNHFALYYQKNKLKFQWIGMEFEHGKVKAYFEIPSSDMADRIENTLFLDVFPQQKNICNLTIGEKSRSYVCSEQQTLYLID